PSPFAGKGFNRVYVHYCSSDQWRGLGHHHDVDFPDICGSVGLDELHFAGGKIVEGVVDMVMNHELAPEASNFIVLAGGSGGGNGVQYNLDRVALQASGVTVLGISDASFGIGLDQDGIPDGNSVENE